MRWQVSFAMHLVLLPVVGAEVNFGPQNCVSLSKTEQGTCMIKTNCDGIDTSSFDFAFVCLTRSGDKETQVKHEYGKGGFDADEDYDTEVHCDECLSEPKVEGSVDGLNDAHAQLQQYSSGAATSAQTPPPKAAAFYGPGGCIAAYRSGEGTCIVQTRCTSQSQAGLMKEYNYGLTCVDNTGDSTRHLFGKNSFDPEETFDTNIECQLCLGFDGSSSSNATDSSLAADVASLQSTVKELEKSVEEIKDKLDIGSKSNSTSSSEKAEPPQQFLRKFKHHYTEKRRQSEKAEKRTRRARRHREEDVDEDFDDDADEDLDDDAQDADDDLDY